MPGLKGMGATVVLALCRCNHTHIAHVGDSRAYLFRNGMLVQVTNVLYSVVGFLLQQGEITESYMKKHPARGTLTRHIYMQADVPADIRTTVPRTEDRILLCSDGLHAMVPESEMSGYSFCQPCLWRRLQGLH